MRPSLALLRAPALQALAVLLLAAALRVSHPEVAWFGGDQARDLRMGRSILAGDLPLKGPAIGATPFHLGPLYWYVVAAGLMPRDEPLDSVRLVAFLNAAGIAGFFLLFRRLAGGKAGLAAGVVLALHPFSLLYGRGLWNPALLEPTACVFLWGVWAWAAERRSGGFLLMAVGGVLMLHVHATAVLLVPLAALGLVRRAPLGLRHGLLGLGVAAVLSVPWLVLEPWPLLFTRDGWHEILQLHLLQSPDYLAAPHWASHLRALGLEYHVPGAALAGGRVWFRAVEVAGAVFSALVVLGLLHAACAGRRQWVRAALLGGAVIVPCLVLPRMRFYLSLYFLGVTYPARALLAVLGAAALARRAGRWTGWGLLALGVGLPAAHVVAATLRAAGDDRLALYTNYVDLRKSLHAPLDYHCIPTLRALRRAGEVFVRDLGLTRLCEVSATAHGIWWETLILDGGFWIREARRRGLVPRPGRQEALLISHRDDPGPRPGRRQRLATFRAASFALMLTRSGLDPASWRVRYPGVTRPGQWLAPEGALPLRPPQGLPAAVAVYRARWDLPEGLSSRPYLCTVTHYEARIVAVAVDGRPVPLAGSWRRGHATLEWFAARGVGPGRHTVTVRAAMTRSGGVCMLDVFDVWPD